MHLPKANHACDSLLSAFLRRFWHKLQSTSSRRSRFFFGLSSTAIYQQMPSQIYRKIRVFPRPTHKTYEEYVKHLGKLWNTCTPGTTSKDYFSSRVIERILQVLSGWMTPWARQEQKPFTMPQFIRLHSLVEKSLGMQETATEFVNFFL